MTRRAEIAGGGIAGLALGTMLSRAGWSVRVHERAPEIREAGAGIYLRGNSLDILEEYGMFEPLARRGTRISTTMSIDSDGTLRQKSVLGPNTRLYVVPRQALVDVLADGARAAGVEIALDSEAVQADPDGTLHLADGNKAKADLVIAADGFNSRLRQRLVPSARHWELETSVNRHFIPNRNITAEPHAVQHWSGNRRIGIAPSGDTHSYVYSICPARDEAGRRLPLDLGNWDRHFPLLHRELREIAAAPVTQYRYVMVRCPSWHVGRVAIIGDAAHGLPPTLGQGAALAIMNGKALTMALDRFDTVEAALDYWEPAVRFISDETQRWSSWYDLFTRAWPTTLEFLRPGIFWAFNRFPALNDRMRIADRGLALTPFRS